ncbi:MAG: hypothetical protein L0Y72_10845 [Gemmataceae bacterium]|nr:hypothetical protein [Gemmataceae bacterium]MCI0739532.1 hypothetical protein [Gemmataceae bacterium]
MRWVLLGDHADGLDMARALADSGRHELQIYSGPNVGMEYLARWGLKPRRVGDLEEALADLHIDAVVVAGSPALRAGQLRRALQSELHVLCVHPADDTPDIGYEAAMIREDVRSVVLLPLLPQALHPGFCRLAELARREEAPTTAVTPAAPSGKLSEASGLAEAIAPGPATTSGLLVESPVGRAPSLSEPRQAGSLFHPAHRAFAVLAAARLLEYEQWSQEDILLDADMDGHQPGLPGWDVLRAIGGEIGELIVLAAGEELAKSAPLLLSGQFVRGGLFQSLFLPNQAETRLRLALVQRHGRIELSFPHGYPGPATLRYVDDQGKENEETWPEWNPWASLVEVFEQKVAGTLRVPSVSDGTRSVPATLSWNDALRGLELDDAARRSLERRRASTLEYQEATEEASFKGTMTLVGCGLLWVSLALLILSVWVPALGWLILPVFGLFLAMQLLRWAVPEKKQAAAPNAPTTQT